jgi:hypothetical protein
MYKMATGSAHVREASPIFVTSDEVLCSSVCHCCSFLEKELQLYVNKIKSMKLLKF